MKNRIANTVAFVRENPYTTVVLVAVTAAVIYRAKVQGDALAEIIAANEES